MIMTVVTAKVAVEQQVAAVKIVMTANMILPHMDLSAVIQPGMNMALIVQHLKVTTAGIAQAVTAQVMVVALTAAPMVVAAVMLVM